MTEQQDPQNKYIGVNAQYIKDLSFENPNAPFGLIAQKNQPKIEINVDINAKTLQENNYELALTINIEAKSSEDASSLFIVELSYAGVFTLQGIDNNEREGILMVYCPNLLFPYARRVISDVTRDGGFPPLMMEPIDFAALYSRNKQQQKTKSPSEESVH